MEKISRENLILCEGGSLFNSLTSLTLSFIYSPPNHFFKKFSSNSWFVMSLTLVIAKIDNKKETK